MKGKHYIVDANGSMEEVEPVVDPAVSLFFLNTVPAMHRAGFDTVVTLEEIRITCAKEEYEIRFRSIAEAEAWWAGFRQGHNKAQLRWGRGVFTV